MHPLEKEILKLIRREKLVNRHDKIVTGVSAGPDSMALLHVLAAIAPLVGFSQIAVYLNHGLRPDETAAEEELVARRAALLGIPFRSGRLGVQEEAKRRKISTEHAARDLRYGFFAKVAGEEDAARICVAHTADDQAEEVLLRLIRGTGRTGLSGMRLMRDGTVIRPFLTTAKDKLLAYLADRHIPHLIDSSNRQRIYLRNRIRLDLLPFLKSFNPNISENLRQTALVLQDEEAVLEDLGRAAWDKCVTRQGEGDDSAIPAPVLLELRSFASLARGIQRRLVEKILVTMESRPRFKKIEQVLFLAGRAETGARLHFSRGLRVKKEKGVLCFSYPAGRVARRGDLEE